MVSDKYLVKYLIFSDLQRSRFIYRNHIYEILYDENNDH